MSDRFPASSGWQFYTVTCAKCGKKRSIRRGVPMWRVLLNCAGLFGWTQWHLWRERKG